MVKILRDENHHEGPTVAEPQPKDAKKFNHKERKKMAGSFQPALGAVTKFTQAAKLFNYSTGSTKLLGGFEPRPYIEPFVSPSKIGLLNRYGTI